MESRSDNFMVLFQWFCKYDKFQKFILNKQISKKDGREYGIERDPGVSSVQETPIIILFMVAPTRIELVSSV